jgi:hypothetical protein
MLEVEFAGPFRLHDGMWCGNKTFTESLILAQDERWRRA